MLIGELSRYKSFDSTRLYLSRFRNFVDISVIEYLKGISRREIYYATTNIYINKNVKFKKDISGHFGNQTIPREGANTLATAG